eukprot:scaffold206332_cov33-Tisochrysis_lutea.AAC.5
MRTHKLRHGEQARSAHEYDAGQPLHLFGRECPERTAKYLVTTVPLRRWQTPRAAQLTLECARCAWPSTPCHHR